MSSFLFFLSWCQPNSFNTFPILITDHIQSHDPLCPLHDLRERGRSGPSPPWLPLCRWWRILLAGFHLLSAHASLMRLPIWLFPNPNTQSPKYILSLDPTTKMHTHVPVGVVDIATNTLPLPRKPSLFSQISDGLVCCPGSRCPGGS